MTNQETNDQVAALMIFKAIHEHYLSDPSDKANYCVENQSVAGFIVLTCFVEKYLGLDSREMIETVRCLVAGIRGENPGAIPHSDETLLTYGLYEYFADALKNRG